MSPVFFWMVRYYFIVQNIIGEVLCGSEKHFVVFCVAVLYMILCACVFAYCVFQNVFCFGVFCVCIFVFFNIKIVRCKS